jgi:hypothetical protein
MHACMHASGWREMEVRGGHVAGWLAGLTGASNNYWKPWAPNSLTIGSYYSSARVLNNIQHSVSSIQLCYSISNLTNVISLNIYSLGTWYPCTLQTHLLESN